MASSFLFRRESLRVISQYHFFQAHPRSIVFNPGRRLILNSEVTNICSLAIKSLSTNLATRKELSFQGDKNILLKPANLTYDPKSTSNPYYGLKQIKPDEANKADKESAGSEIVHNEKEDDECRLEYFDLTTRPKPEIIEIPLPERLRVPILHLPTAEQIGSISLSPEVFGCDPIRVDILHRVVVYQRNKKRGKRNAGARTKTISEVSGSGRKVRQQKGSGKARAGHSRPAHWRGGAKAHGPKGKIQDYTTKLNKKVRAMGLRMALSQKLKEGNVIVVGEMGLPSFRTSEAVNALNLFGIGGKRGATAYMLDNARNPDPESQNEDKDDETLSVSGVNANLMVATRNLHKVKLKNAMLGNVYDILKHEKLMLSLKAILTLENKLTPKS